MPYILKRPDLTSGLPFYERDGLEVLPQVRGRGDVGRWPTPVYRIRSNLKFLLSNFKN